MPEPRWFHGSGVVDGALYVFGGDTEPSRHSAMRRMDVRVGSWSAPIEAVLPPSVSPRLVGSSVGPGLFPSYGEAPLGDVRRSLAHYPGSGSFGREVYHYGPYGGLLYSPERDAWSFPSGTRPRLNRLKRMQGAVPRWDRTGHRAVEDSDGRIYVLGGLARRQGRLPGSLRVERGADSESEPQITPTMEVFERKTGRFRALAPMRQPRQLFAAAFGADGKLYVFGGFASRGRRRVEAGEEAARRRRLERAAAARVLDSVEVYDPVTDSWEPAPPLPEPRHQFDAALGSDGRIYVVGGADAYSSPRSTRDVFAFDPRAGTWHEAPPLRVPRYGHSVARSPEGLLYVSGGIDSGDELPGLEALGIDRAERLASVERLDTRDFVSRPLPRSASPDLRARLEAAVELLRSAPRPTDEVHLATTEIARSIAASDTAWVPSLVDALASPHAEIRASMARAIGYVLRGDGPAAEALSARLADPDARVRWAAADALIRAGTQEKPVREMLVRALRSEDRAERVRAVERLGPQGAETLPALAAELQASHPFPEFVVEALGGLGSAAAESLVAALAHPTARVRAFAAAELGRLPARPETLAALGRGTSDAERDVRLQSILALANLGDSAIPPLLAALESPHWDVQASAVWALGEVGRGDAAAERAVRERLPDPERLPRIMPPVQRAACEAVGRWGVELPYDCKLPRPPGSGQQIMQESR